MQSGIPSLYGRWIGTKFIWVRNKNADFSAALQANVYAKYALKLPTRPAVEVGCVARTAKRLTNAVLYLFYLIAIVEKMYTWTLDRSVLVTTKMSILYLKVSFSKPKSVQFKTKTKKKSIQFTVERCMGKYWKSEVKRQLQAITM